MFMPTSKAELKSGSLQAGRLGLPPDTGLPLFQIRPALDVSEDIGLTRAPTEKLLGSLTGGLLIQHQCIGVGIWTNSTAKDPTYIRPGMLSHRSTLQSARIRRFMRSRRGFRGERQER